LPNTELGNITPAFGSGEMWKQEFYYTAGAGSLAGTITFRMEKVIPMQYFFLSLWRYFLLQHNPKWFFRNGNTTLQCFSGFLEGAILMGHFYFYWKRNCLAHAVACSYGSNGNLGRKELLFLLLARIGF